VVPGEAGFERFSVAIQTEGWDMVNAVITSPTTDESQGVRLSPDGQWLDINLPPLEIGSLWTTNITIQVTPLVPRVEYMPYVHIGWGETLASGTTSGNSVSYRAGDPMDEVGTWTWSAADSYAWHWTEYVGKFVKWFAHARVP
jgi:hypothetical protein